MTGARIGGGTAVPATSGDSHAFAASLQAQMAGGTAGTVDPLMAGMPTPASLQAQLQSSSGLGIQAAMVGAAAPTQPSRLKGDLEGLDPKLRAALEQVGAKLGTTVEVKSGARSHAEQQVLYEKYLNGTGNLAAVPGTSRHESGRAADVYVNGVALADAPGGREAAAAAGLGFPVAGEAWHTELAA